MICIIIPVKKLSKSKSRLANILNQEERERLSLYLLQDMLSIIDKNIFDVFIVGSDYEVKVIAERFGACFINDESKGVNDAIALTNEYCKDYDASIIIPIDLPLIKPMDLITLYDMANTKRRGIIITPSSRLDGTNILLRKPALVMDTYYDMDSYLIHINKALEQGLEISILLNDRLRYDLDEITDINHIIEFDVNKKSISYLRALIKNKRLSNNKIC